MKDYDKRACERRARAELALVISRIKDEAHDRMKAFIDAACATAIKDGRALNVDEVGTNAAAYGGEPWGVNSKPALEHKPSRASKARKR